MNNIEFLTFTILKNWQGKKIFNFELTPLFGDASSREYYRLAFDEKSYVVMKVAETKPGEFGRGDSYNDFYSMQQLLLSLGLRVPEVLYKYDPERVMILEDLGDETLFNVLNARPEDRLIYMKDAVNLLIKWQEAIWERRTFDSAGDKKVFKSKLFMQEFYHFYEYMVEKRVYSPSFRGVWRKAEKDFKKISGELSRSVYTLSHRDFQSKNIMMKNDQLYLIDFQDALQAPVLYDLVALLRDSYITLKKSELDYLLDHYWEGSTIAKEVFGERESYHRLFHLQTLQRKMKDAGRFIYLNQVKDKKWFIPYVKPTLLYVRDSLLHLDYNSMLELFAPYIPEFSDEGGIK